MNNGAVGLLQQKLGRTVGRPIVDKYEAVKTQPAIMRQKIGKAQRFVPDDRKDHIALGRNRDRSRDDRQNRFAHAYWLMLLPSTGGYQTWRNASTWSNPMPV